MDGRSRCGTVQGLPARPSRYLTAGDHASEQSNKAKRLQLATQRRSIERLNTWHNQLLTRNRRSIMLSKLAYWSGLASILGGVLFGVAVVLHPLRDGISIFNSGVAYGAIHNVGVFGLMLQLFGLVGLYIREADTMGKRGLTSFVVVFFGQVFYICLLVVDGLRNPLLARFAPDAVHTVADSDPNLFAMTLPALGLFFLGYILFGVNLLHTKSLP